MMDAINKRVSYDIGCMKSLRKLPDRVSLKFMDLMTRYMSDPSANGLNLETVEGAKDSSIKSLRVDQGYRAIAFEVGRDIMFVHVNEHDKAYRWAVGRRVKLDPSTNRSRASTGFVHDHACVCCARHMRNLNWPVTSRIKPLSAIHSRFR